MKELLLNININLETCRFQHKNPTGPTRSFVQNKLATTGISKSTLAKQIGYTNLNKGSRRIQEWVRTEQVQSSSQGEKFLQAIGVTRDELTKENQTYHRKISAKIIYRENNFEHNMLAKHVDLLMEHVYTICRSPQWRNIHLPYVGIFSMYFNTGSIRLGQLLQAWQNNYMRLGEYHVVKVVGSPLSGSHWSYGFTKNGDTLWENRGRIFERLGDGIQLFPKKDKGLSYWSLGQLLVDLGIELPPTTLYQKRKAIGQYDYATKQLTLLNETYDLSECFDDHTHIVQPAASLHPILSSVTLYKQNLQSPEGILCHWDQDIPPIVAERVTRLLLTID